MHHLDILLLLICISAVFTAIIAATFDIIDSGALFVHFVYGLNKVVHVVSVEPVQVVDIALLVDEFIGGEGIHFQELLDSDLLLSWQIIVNAVGTREIVLFDDVLPRFVAAAVGVFFNYYF